MIRVLHQDSQLAVRPSVVVVIGSSKCGKSMLIQHLLRSAHTSSVPVNPHRPSCSLDVFETQIVVAGITRPLFLIEVGAQELNAPTLASILLEADAILQLQSPNPKPCPWIAAELQRYSTLPVVEVQTYADLATAETSGLCVNNLTGMGTAAVWSALLAAIAN